MLACIYFIHFLLHSFSGYYINDESLHYLKSIVWHSLYPKRRHDCKECSKRLLQNQKNHSQNHNRQCNSRPSICKYSEGIFPTEYQTRNMQEFFILYSSLFKNIDRTWTLFYSFLSFTFSSSTSTALATSLFCSKTSSKFIFGTLARMTEHEKWKHGHELK